MITNVQPELTTTEHDELTRCESVIEQGLRTFVDVGTALLTIRDGRLYREDWGTFEDYCQGKWGMVRRHANRMIAAAQAVVNLGPIGPIPQVESQARPLTQLAPDDQRIAWERAIETAPEGKITGAHVQRVVDGMRELPGTEDLEDDDDIELCAWLASYNNVGDDVCRSSGNVIIGTECGPHCPLYAIEEPKFSSEGQPHVSHNSGNNEWYTPPKFIEAARQVMGQIDLDPASSDIANQTVQATTFYTEQDDGLQHDWHGRVWMNPPYASPLIGQFSDKLVEHIARGSVPEACVRVNNATETAWFGAMLDVADCVCFIKTRVKFIDADGNPSGAPLQGQAILYAGPNWSMFGQVFSEFGRVLYAWRD